MARVCGGRGKAGGEEKGKAAYSRRRVTQWQVVYVKEGLVCGGGR